jgi:hypothetical protein
MSDFGNLKSGGDAINYAEGSSQSGDVDSSGAGVGTGVLGSLGLGIGGGFGISGDAYTGQLQHAEGGDVSDNTNIGDININT